MIIQKHCYKQDPFSMSIILPKFKIKNIRLQNTNMLLVMFVQFTQNRGFIFQHKMC